MRFGFSRDPIYSDPGSPLAPIYDSVIVDGDLDLIQVGQQDIPTLINSFADDCDLATIVSRLIAGDASVLRPGAIYADFSDCKFDHAAMLQSVLDAQVYFDRLPDNIKSKFDGFVDWFSCAGSERWTNAFNSPKEVVSNNEP